MEEYKHFEEDGKNLNRQAGRSRPTDGEEEEFRIETVRCEICGEFIGKCDMSKFSAPINANMFISKDHKHGYPAPFYGQNLDWIDIRCPICKKRPFISYNYFRNLEGKKCGNIHECSTCGKGFPTALGLNVHIGQAHNEVY